MLNFKRVCNKFFLTGEGKSSTPNQKLAIITSIGNCSFNCCQNRKNIIAKILGPFEEFLKVETNENTAIYTLKQLNQWFSSLKAQDSPADLVAKLNDFFKVGQISES